MTSNSRTASATAHAARRQPWPRTAIALAALLAGGAVVEARAQPAPPMRPGSDAAGNVTTPPAQKKPAKPGAQGGPDAAASAASGAMGGMSPPAEKKPAKPGAQSGPSPAASR